MQTSGPGGWKQAERLLPESGGRDGRGGRAGQPRLRGDGTRPPQAWFRVEAIGEAAERAGGGVGGASPGGSAGAAEEGRCWWKSRCHADSQSAPLHRRPGFRKSSRAHVSLVGQAERCVQHPKSCRLPPPLIPPTLLGLPTPFPWSSLHCPWCLGGFVCLLACLLNPFAFFLSG